MTWNEGQTRTLAARGRDVLVSAAAGSGKTSVLTERVIRHVRDDGCDLREMLVVTFSNAAAAEMKERIYRALSEASASGGVRLLRQAELVADADICTIHSFCGRILREHFEQSGLPPRVYTLSGGEAALLREAAMEALFDARYEAEDDGFLRLVRRYGGRSDKPVRDFLFRLHDYFASLPDHLSWIAEKEDMQRSAAFLNALGEDYDRRNAAALDEAAMLFKYSADLSRRNGHARMAQREEENTRTVRGLQDIYTRRGREAFGEAFSTAVFLPGEFRGMEPAFRERVQAARDLAKKIARGVACDEYLVGFAQKVKAEIEGTLPDVCALQSLYAAFAQQYAQIKREKNAIDFNDMEHRALTALKDESVRDRYAGKYRFVFVDEYQDTNPVQEAILSLVSRGDNRFMVGDLKQSIYRFRQADPMIFRARAQAYQDGEAQGLLVHMNENFRSAGGIIAFVNHCMAGLMSDALGDIDYNGGEALTGGSGDGGSVSLMLTTGDGPAPEDGEAEGELDAAEELNETEREAHAVAQRINAVLSDAAASGETWTYADVAVLMRDIKNNGRIFKSVFSGYGIPAFVETDATMADYPEAQAFLDLLRIVDDRMQDIPLIAVMRSAFGGFTAGELADIRIHCNDQETPYCEAVRRYADERDDALSEKLRAFLGKIRRLRLMSQSLRVEEFLLIAERETGFGERIASLKGGDGKYAALSGILENAALAGEGATESLHAFIGHIEDMQRTGKLSELLGAQQAGNAVRIMSIHKSKGLEFPVVFIARINRRFNLADCREGLLVCREIGLAIKYTDEERLVKKDTYIKRKAAQNIRAAALSEELRVLYVAMTRAKKQLILSGSVKDLQKSVMKWSKPVTPYGLLQCSATIDWLMPLILMLDGAQCLLEGQSLSSRPDGASPRIRVTAGPCALPAAGETGRRRELLEGFFAGLPENASGALSFRYPYAGDLSVPSKRSVTDIKKAQDPGPDFTRPSAAGETDGDARPRGALRGTATHIAMRHIDFAEQDVPAALQRLAEGGFLSPEEAGEVDPEWIETFLRSEIAARIRASAAAHRETPFCLKVKASELGYEGAQESVVLQGVIDLCFLEDNKWTVLDYKTDRVDERTAPLAAAGYQKQLDLYALALERITGIPVAHRYVYFFRRGLFAV